MEIFFCARELNNNYIFNGSDCFCPVVFCRTAIHLIFYPAHEDFNYVLLLAFTKRPVLRDMVPLMETAAAAAGGGVLGDENGMPFHGSLFSVILRLSRRQFFGNKIHGVPADHLLTL